MILFLMIIAALIYISPVCGAFFQVIVWGASSIIIVYLLFSFLFT